jgi:hypothetical protein
MAATWKKIILAISVALAAVSWLSQTFCLLPLGMRDVYFLNRA